MKELRTLVHMARVPPSAGQWSAFYARLCRLIALLINLAERTIRFGVLWRKRSQGTRGDKSEFCPCAIPVSSNASPPSMSLWMRSLLISRDKNLTLNG